MLYTDDPVKDFERHDREQERLLERLPVCDDCGDRINEDYYFAVTTDCGTDILCEECMNHRYRRNTENY